jgi:allantoinase
MTDLVIRGGSVVAEGMVVRADLAVEGQAIAAIGPELPGGRHEIDARGWHVLPGLIDVHLHFNEPGHDSWEGAATGSRALAAGGGTVFFDMPLNSVPCTVNAGEFDRKRQALEAASVTDFGLWGGLTPGSLDQMDELAARGVVGFKAFMCDSGLPEFPRADDDTLARGMEIAARLRLPVAVHAESENLICALAAEHGTADPRAFLASRPLAAELAAIDRALALAASTGARLHIVHVSAGTAVAHAGAARSKGVDVSIETCPHYLFFTAADLEASGTLLKCAPPLRDDSEQEGLWDAVLNGSLDIVASDHSPAEPSMKLCAFGDAWGGIAGVQSMLAVLLDRGLPRGLTMPRVASMVAGTPARRFAIHGKGELRVGYDADITLVDLEASGVLGPGDLLQRHPISPYVGHRLRGVVRRTLRRGQTIFVDGRIVAGAKGKLVRPGPPDAGHHVGGTRL